MDNSIFIKFPAKAMYQTPKQIKTAYNIIIKAFLYKFTYEHDKAMNVVNEQFNLNNVKVFNSFVNEISKTISDTRTSEYILETIKNIRCNDFSKKTVVSSYHNLCAMFGPNAKSSEIIGNLISEDPNKFIDFKALFERCNTYILCVNYGPLKEVNDFYQQHIIDTTKQDFKFL